MSETKVRLLKNFFIRKICFFLLENTIVYFAFISNLPLLYNQSVINLNGHEWIRMETDGSRWSIHQSVTVIQINKSIMNWINESRIHPDRDTTADYKIVS
jgi:hypothetical protein